MCPPSRRAPYQRPALQIPFKVLQFLFTEINYGGRVTDDKDRRLIKSLVKGFCAPKVQAGASPVLLLSVQRAFRAGSAHFGPHFPLVHAGLVRLPSLLPLRPCACRPRRLARCLMRATPSRQAAPTSYPAARQSTRCAPLRLLSQAANSPSCASGPPPGGRCLNPSLATPSHAPSCCPLPFAAPSSWRLSRRTPWRRRRPSLGCMTTQTSRASKCVDGAQGACPSHQLAGLDQLAACKQCC
jgi:hypothetical protein